MRQNCRRWGGRAKARRGLKAAPPCLAAILGAVAFLAPAGAATRVCPGSVSAGTVQLRVQPNTGGEALPIRRVNTIPAGYKLLYRPLGLPQDVRNDAKVTLVVVPAGTSTQATVLELKPASVQAEWTAGFRESRRIEDPFGD